MTAAPKPPENRHNKQQETKTNGGEKLQLRTSKGFFFFFSFSLCWELVQVIMTAAGEVSLQYFRKQVPFQQAVGHGQKLLDNLVEILEKVRKAKVNNTF